jgi:very-short-patch-repair endonuclease
MQAAELAVMAGPWAGLGGQDAATGQSDALHRALGVLARCPAAAAQLTAPLQREGQPADETDTVDQLQALAGQLEGVAAWRRMAGSPLRLLRPAYYRARSRRAAYLEAGYAETRNEAQTAAALRTLVAEYRGALALGGGAFPGLTADAPLTRTATWAQSLLDTFDSLPVAIEINGVLARLEPPGMRAGVAALLRDSTVYGKLAETLRASIYAAWAAQIAGGPLATTPGQHDRAVASFGRVDGEMLGWARSSVLGSLRGRRPAAGPNHPAFVPLLKYARAKRRPSLRIMLANTREAVQTLKPCLLMSPLAAAQYLCQEGAGYAFDAVIVDEASMIPTPDLVVALSLGSQAIISGDSKQMPPTNFFNREIAPPGEDDPDEPDVTFESVLDECAPILPSTMLRAHYRSRDDALIAFSNVHFYDGKLIAFPDPWDGRPESGVRFEYVADAVYGRGGSRANAAEARRAVQLLRSELAASNGQKQVAITAMSLAQQQEVLQQLDDFAMLDPVLRGWLDGGGQVRNLETVQGDECDVMILSIGYGKDADGRLTLNFGPLGQEKGERRLNVAITRARWKTIVVSSLKAPDIDPGRTNSTGTLRLRDYLDYAERGPAALVASAPAIAAGEPTGFERVVAAALGGAGLKCLHRVGVGGYQVDLGVLHPLEANRFVLGIECDGPAYSGAPAARDRDLLRACVLERMGWNLERAWSAAWFKNPEAELERLLVRYRAILAAEASGRA